MASPTKNENYNQEEPIFPALEHGMQARPITPLQAPPPINSNYYENVAFGNADHDPALWAHRLFQRGTTPPLIQSEDSPYHSREPSPMPNGGPGGPRYTSTENLPYSASRSPSHVPGRGRSNSIRSAHFDPYPGVQSGRQAQENANGSHLSVPGPVRSRTHSPSAAGRQQSHGRSSVRQSRSLQLQGTRPRNSPMKLNDNESRPVNTPHYEYQCPLCDQSISRLGDLPRHYQDKHFEGNEPIHCPWDDCTDTFTRTDNLKRHFLNKHKLDIEVAKRDPVMRLKIAKANKISNSTLNRAKEELWRDFTKEQCKVHKAEAEAERSLGCHHRHVLLRDMLSHLHKPENHECRALFNFLK